MKILKVIWVLVFFSISGFSFFCLITGEAGNEPIVQAVFLFDALFSLYLAIVPLITKKKH